jgi:protocatechuate 3,4-dioxygenase beta subunit
MFSGIARLRCLASWARAGLAATVGAVAVLGVCAGAPLPADAGESATPAGLACPSPNLPNMLTLVAGTPQTAPLEAAFATGLQIALSNSDGCPVTGAAGVPVTFSAPSSGASGLFSDSGSNAVTVGSDATNAAAAPAFTANSKAGSYTVTASSQYGSVSFSLTNTAAGVPARVTALAPTSRSATVTHGYAQPLQVRVLDAAGNPVAGATVTFTLASTTGASACGADSSASASFVGGADPQASATTDASGIATSPPLTANAAAGEFTATATLSSGGGSGASGAAAGAAASAATAAEASFVLRNRAGEPSRLTAGIGATQATATGTRFPIRLAVTVDDAEKNPVPGALVTFAAPATDPGASFTIRFLGSRHDRSHIFHRHTVRVETDACGIAVAPALTAGRPGGYIVEASAAHTKPAAFALVNEQPGRRP